MENTFVVCWSPSLGRQERGACVMRSTSTKVRGLVKAAATPRGVLGSSKAVITTLLLQAFPLRFGEPAAGAAAAVPRVDPLWPIRECFAASRRGCQWSSGRSRCLFHFGDIYLEGPSPWAQACSGQFPPFACLPLAPGDPILGLMRSP